jgi:hypothetical protein
VACQRAKEQSMKAAEKGIGSSSADPEAQLTGFIEKFEPKHRSLIRASHS